MAKNVHITRIKDTWANVLSNLDDGQTALLTNLNNEHVFRLDDGTAYFHYITPNKVWEVIGAGGSFTYNNTEYNDVTARNDLIAGRYISHLGDSDTRFEFSTDRIKVLAGNVEFIDILEDGTQDLIEFNSAKSDVDFIFNTAVADSLFIQGSTGYVGIGTTAPDSIFTISTLATDEAYPLLIENTNGSSQKVGLKLSRHLKSFGLQINNSEEEIQLIDIEEAYTIKGWRQDQSDNDTDDAYSYSYMKNTVSGLHDLEFNDGIPLFSFIQYSRSFDTTELAGNMGIYNNPSARGYWPLWCELDTGKIGLGKYEPGASGLTYDVTVACDDMMLVSSVPYSTDTTFIINHLSNGDSVIDFQLDSSSKAKVYVDNSDSDKFKIDVGGSDRVTIDSSGRTHLGSVTTVGKLGIDGTIYLKEQGTADGDTAAYGQIWVKNTDPNELWFTNGDGTDTKIV